MKKKLFISLLILLVNGCLAQSSDDEKNTSKVVSQIILDKDTVVFVKPSKKTINELKVKMSDDFYSVADDANYYSSFAYDYLNSINEKYLLAQDDISIFYKGNDGKLNRIVNKKY